MLLSRLLRNFPRMLIAMTRRPLSASMSNTVETVSYRIEFPTFFVESVLVATYRTEVDIEYVTVKDNVKPEPGYHSWFR
jgi:hypothetical protein